MFRQESIRVDRMAGLQFGQVSLQNVGQFGVG
jgi:hypothetical protein